MKISARNQLKGVVKSVTEGAVNGIVTVEDLVTLPGSGRF